MNAVYEDQLISKLLSLSVSKDIEIAKNEWLFNGEVIDYGPIKDQIKKINCDLCGHPIRYQYIITNKENKRKMGIGSECIGNYTSVHYSRIEGSLKKLKQDQYKKVYDAYRKASWTISTLRAIIRDKINNSGHDYHNPLNKDLVKDYESFSTNNETTIFHAINSGIAYTLAEKYGYKLRTDYLNEFITEYSQAKKSKFGFLKRP